MVHLSVLDARDDEQFAAWYAALRAGAAAGRHAPVVTSAAALRSQLLHQTRAVRHAVGAFEGGVCVGTAVLERDTEHDTHLGEVDVTVPPEDRRRGIGSLLLDEMAAQAATAGLTTLLGEVTALDGVSPGLSFARRAGFESVHTEERLVLDLPLPPGRLAQLAASGDAARRGWTLTSWTGLTPEQHLATMARLRSGMNAEVPTGDVDSDPEVVTPESLAAADVRLQDRGHLSLVSLVTAPDGRPAGYSLLLVQGSDRGNALQDDTYVLAGDRGHGIGSWLKAANLHRLASEVPEARYVHTWTDATNGPMRAVNARFGFRAVEVMHEVQRGGRPQT